MRPSKILLVDSLINLILGGLLATFPKRIVELLGVPHADATFYPSILGAVLIGIGVALVIEYLRKPTGPAGLGLYGAVAINLCGALFLAGWLLSGKLEILLRGRVFLWGLAAVLIVISFAELFLSREDGTMCGEQAGCQKPEELKGDPKECSPEQARKGHGDVKKHPCAPADEKDEAGEE